MDEEKIIHEIEKTLDHLIKPSSTATKNLYEGARYLIFAPSKRIRPLFTISMASLFKVPIEHCLYPACAIELIHTYSLIHDDLPCMDNDDYRRGQLSLHKVYDEASALLIGDYLLTYAFEVLADAPHITAEKKISLVKTLSKHAGSEGMIGGQLLDLQNPKGSIEEIHKKKTAALFMASFEYAGILANLSPTMMKTLSLLGEKVGLLFQLIDDLVDGDFSGEFEMGKQQAQALFQEILTLLVSISENTSSIEAIIERILSPLHQRTT